MMRRATSVRGHKKRRMLRVGDNTRFGVQLSDLPVELEFGEWGVLETVQALDLFDNAHTYFDQEDVQKAEQARRAYIQSAWRYYDGHHRKPLVVKQIGR